MKLTKQLKAEIADVYEAFWGALFYADIDMYSLFLDEDYRLIGTTEQEFFFSKAEAVRFLKATADQLAGNLERRNSRHKIDIIENLVFITDQFDAYVLIDEKWSFYEKTRVTTLLQEKKAGWKIIQQHFSFPDNKAGSGQTIGLEKIAKENLQLKEAIRRRTIELELKNRELVIEFSLERVRAVAMGMKQPADMLEVCEVIARELISLGVGPIRNIQTAVIDVEKETYQNYEYYQVAREKLVTTVAYKEHPTIHAFVKRMVKDPEGFYARRMIGEGLKKWLKYQAKAGQFVDPTSTKVASLHYYFYSIGSGALGITTYAPLSKEAVGLFKRFRNVFQLAYARFVDIQQAEEQTKEARVQLAMERVRARTMAMQSSDELPVAANLLFQQVQSLGMPAWSAGYCIWDDNKKGVTLWMSSEGVMQPAFHAPLTKDLSFMHMREAFEQGRDFHVEEVGGKALVTHYKYMRTLPVVGEVLDSIIAAGHPLPVYQIFHCVYFSHGFLLFITYEPVPEAHVIFKRFGTVFDQTYTRFLDLQKAEAQAREAQIEASLERVRSRAMAMHSSAELTEVALELRKQMGRIGQKDLEVCAIHLYDDTHSFESWSAMKVPGSANEILQTQARFPKKGIRIVDELMKNYSEGEKDYVIVNAGAKSVEWFSVLKEYAPELHVSIIQAIGDMPLNKLKSNWSVADFSGGALVMVTYGEPDPASRNLLRRSANVFEQAYIRFLDLKKAEGQAREAQIEVALERVRSRSMAMHKSEELADLSLELVKQVQALGVATWFCAFNIKDDEVQGSLEWGSNGQGTFPTYRTPREGVFLRYYEAGQKGETLLINEIGEAECPAHYEYLCTLPGLGEQLLGMKNAGIAFPVSQIDHVAFFKYGYIIFITYKAVPESHDIFVRFARIFEQTYTRFLDLKKAEAQAKEAQIEAALEKVRSRTMAMQSSNELQETAAVLFNEFKKLGTDNVYQVTIGIYNEEEGLIDFRVTSWAGSGAQENRSFKLDMNEPTVLKPAVDAWKANKKSLVIDLSGETLEGWLNYRNKMSGVAVSSADTAGRRVITVAYYSKGHLSISTPVPVPTETQRILERFAAVFDSTYTRFLDLKKAEAQALRAEQDLMAIKEAKQNAEEALAELQTTQKQLIQAEKMASLGELTAGIAHEIQNPLNFVNNFSEVSKELLDEMREAIEKGDAEEAKEIMNDVIQNLEKINHHGKRADGIVKGMLQHSRSSSGVKEPTDINELADEYLRLAYHGLRAKDKSFNATLKTEFDDTIGSISVIPQDIGRVILNLITNAFYAVDEKKKRLPAGYDPEVIVTTRSQKSLSGDASVVISVKDNGNGVPQNVIDKIFQPFFTTKPTGQGTGLGLSLSYDIVKAHGGELKVVTKEGEGSEFIIVLPI